MAESSRKQLDREITEALAGLRFGRSTLATASSHLRRRSPPERRVAYRLQLTPAEVQAAEHARGRYEWPDMLLAHLLESGLVAFSESEMWQWTDDVDSDDAPFPLASPGLVAKLQDFYDSRV